MIERYQLERDENWRDFAHRMPYIQFPADWKICIIPPFAGAFARFLVELPDGRKKSIYFDANDSLGCVGQPYWEVHPVRGDCGRCLMYEIEELLLLIQAPSEE